MKIAIHQNEKIYSHSTLWSKPWIEYCQKHKLDYSIVNCYDKNILDKLREYDYLLWHICNYCRQDMLFARNILYAARQEGLKVFPDFNTSWHYDDKIAGYYLLKSADAPIPQAWIFYTESDCLSWLRNEAQYPIVGKLRCGAGSNNVRLIKDYSQGRSYAKTIFAKGFKNVPQLAFKAKSNILSTHDWETFMKRFKRIPEFLKTQIYASKFDAEKGYAYFQEYIPNDGFDLKITVVGDKICFCSRKAREGDFRASGSGVIYYDRSLVPHNIIESAFKTTDLLGFQSMGYDYVVNKDTNKGLIIELSYCVPYTTMRGAGGYWDRNGTWHDEPVNVAEEVLINLLKPESNVEPVAAGRIAAKQL